MSGSTASQDQYPQGHLGRVSHRGEGIRGQDRQRNQTGEPLGISLRARQGTPQPDDGQTTATLLRTTGLTIAGSVLAGSPWPVP